MPLEQLDLNKPWPLRMNSLSILASKSSAPPPFFISRILLFTFSTTYLCSSCPCFYGCERDKLFLPGYIFKSTFTQLIRAFCSRFHLQHPCRMLCFTVMDNTGILALCSDINNVEYHKLQASGRSCPQLNWLVFSLSCLLIVWGNWGQI